MPRLPRICRLPILPQDIQLAKDLLASSPSAQEKYPVAGEHGVDIILGGHDHSYFVSKGVTTWNGYDTSKPNIGTEGDDGNILIVKSGSDFRELSELTLELVDTPPGSVRKKVIKAVHGECLLILLLSETANRTSVQANVMRSGPICHLRRTCRKSFMTYCRRCPSR